MKRSADKQNRRFLRNSRTAAALSAEEEVQEVHGAGVRKALRRTSQAAFVAKLKSEKINFALSRVITNALLDVKNSKLTRREVEIVKHFDQLMHMDLKQARSSRLCPTKEDVVILFKILKKASPSKAEELSLTFKFRKLN